MRTIKYVVVVLVAGLALAMGMPSAEAVEVEVKKVLFIPTHAEIRLTHQEVQAIQAGQHIPLPAPYNAAVALVAGILHTFDQGNGVKVIVPITFAPIVVVPR